MYKIRKNDQVVVLKGKDSGRHGKVLRVIHSTGKILVEGINLVKKHVKPNPQKGVSGGVVAREGLINISNLAIYNPNTKKADRVGVKSLEDGRKVRFFKSNKELIDI